MAQSQIPDIPIELLLAAARRPSIGKSVQSGLEGYKEGVNLSGILQDRKAKRNAEQQALMQEIQKAMSSNAFVKEAQTPIPTSRDINKPAMQTMSPVELPSGVLVAPQGPSEQVPASIFKKPLSSEEIAQEAMNKKERMKGFAAGVIPEEAAKLALTVDKQEDTSAKQMEIRQVNLPGVGPTYINIDKIRKKAYDLQGNDITEQAADAIPYFAPATITGTSGIYMTPRVEGTYRGAAGVPKGQRITSLAQLTPTEASVLEKTKEDFNTDEAAKVSRTKQADYDMADSVVGIGNWVGDAAVLSVAAKGLGRDVGNLSTEEQRRYRMSPAILDMIKTKANLWSQGIIRPEDRDAFKEAIRVMKQKNLDILNAKRETYGKLAETRVPNIDATFARNYIYEPATMTQFDAQPRTGLTPEKKARMEELRAKKAAGTLR